MLNILHLDHLIQPIILTQDEVDLLLLSSRPITLLVIQLLLQRLDDTMKLISFIVDLLK